MDIEARYSLQRQHDRVSANEARDPMLVGNPVDAALHRVEQRDVHLVGFLSPVRAAPRRDPAAETLHRRNHPLQLFRLQQSLSGP